MHTLRSDPSRPFFVAIGVFCILLAIVGFGPSLYLYFTAQYEFPPIVHLHAAIMIGWVVLFTTQANLAHRADLALHRRLGWIGIGLAALVVISMIVATIVALRRYDPDKMAFLVKPLLIQIGSIVVFATFVTWAVLARRRTMWHKRLMALATMALVQAALDRFHWIPETGLPMFWDSGVRLYVLLLLPLWIFDFVTIRRIHPATLAGSAIIVAMHGVVSYYWSHEGWNQVARGFWMWVR